VTKSEADAYKPLARRLSEQLALGFDPIALRLSVTDSRLAGDLTVMPLIGRSEFDSS